MYDFENAPLTAIVRQLADDITALKDALHNAQAEIENLKNAGADKSDAPPTE